MRRLICAFVVRIWHKTHFLMARLTAKVLPLLQMSRDMTKPAKWLWAQRRLRSAWTSAQSDQSSLSTWRKLGSLATHWAHSKDSDQTGRMPRLIWVFAGCTGHFVGFVMSWLKCSLSPKLPHVPGAHQTLRSSETDMAIFVKDSFISLSVKCYSSVAVSQNKWNIVD